MPACHEYGPGLAGRQFATNTRLGKIAARRGVTAKELAAHTLIHNRTLTEYMAGRKKILPHHVVPLCEVLQVSPQVLLGPEKKRGLRPRGTLKAESSA